MSIKKLFFAFTAAFFFLSASLAHATGGWAFAPPDRYKGEPKMKVYIIAQSITKLQKSCNNKAFPIRMLYGCAQVYKNPERCVVFIPDKSFPNFAWPVGGVAVVTPKMVLVHEKAHCAGWHRSHPR